MTERNQNSRHVEWEAKKCASLDEMRTENIRFWQRQGGAAIRKAAWELVVESWDAQKRDINELRFQRSSSLAGKE